MSPQAVFRALLRRRPPRVPVPPWLAADRIRLGLVSADLADAVTDVTFPVPVRREERAWCVVVAFPLPWDPAGDSRYLDRRDAVAAALDVVPHRVEFDGIGGTYTIRVLDRPMVDLLRERWED